MASQIHKTRNFLALLNITSQLSLHLRMQRPDIDRLHVFSKEKFKLLYIRTVKNCLKLRPGFDSFSSYCLTLRCYGNAECIYCIADNCIMSRNKYTEVSAVEHCLWRLLQICIIIIIIACRKVRHWRIADDSARDSNATLMQDFFPLLAITASLLIWRIINKCYRK